MKKECDKYSKCDHNDCGLDCYEEIVAEYFESRGLDVEKLCKGRLPKGERTPDFLITGDNDLYCLCEVKALKESPTGALSKSDWEYANPVVNRKYPTGGRNITKKEKTYEKQLKDYLDASSVADKGLEVKIHRGDWLVWTEDERSDFADYLIEKLKLIDGGQTPRGWHEESGLIMGAYRKERKDMWPLQNEIIVMRTSPPLSVKVTSYLGPNWEAIENRCKGVKKQIRDGLARLNQEKEVTPDKVVRLLIVFVEKFPPPLSRKESEELLGKINTLTNKFQELSVIAFSDISLDSEAQTNYSGMISHFFPYPPDENRRFLVFHASNQAIPRLPDEVFDDGYSDQIKFSV